MGLLTHRRTSPLAPAARAQSSRRYPDPPHRRRRGGDDDDRPANAPLLSSGPQPLPHLSRDTSSTLFAFQYTSTAGSRTITLGMCRKPLNRERSSSTEFGTPSKAEDQHVEDSPAAPSMLARYTCASILMAFFAVWGKYTFVPENEQPGIGAPMHSWKIPAALTIGYLVSLPILRYLVENFVSKKTDMKVLLTESMILVRMKNAMNKSVFKGGVGRTITVPRVDLFLLLQHF